ncbi:MAG: hypothetical protein HYT42_02035 [Candidatus Sungbacteria bacterium]|nr:hypothetical protein [Candidatus Sungbacteria bacterium]
MFDVMLLAVFIAAASYVVLTVWRKIPLLVQVPQRLIHESFVTRPSRVHQYAGPLVVFFRSGRYREVYYSAIIKILSGFRLWLLRMERTVFALIETVQSRKRHWSSGFQNYWGELKQWKQDKRENGEALPESVLNPEAPPEVEEKSPFQNGKR